MKTILYIAQIIISFFLIILILLQPKGSNVFFLDNKFQRTLRGWEKQIFWGTLFLGFIFIFLGILNLALK